MRQLLLVGGGHAHVEVVRRWAEAPLPDCQLTVVDPNPRPVYSGMVPGFIAGEYRREELEIDLAKLCARAGARYLQARAERIGAQTRTLCVAPPREHEGEPRPAAEGPEVLGYDVASIDIGSQVAGGDRAARSRLVLSSRPIPKLVEAVDGLLERARSAPRFVVHVVGAGAGGVEIAFCLEARLRRIGARAELTLVTAERRLLAHAAASQSRAITRAARARGIQSRLETFVSEVDADGLRLETGELLASDAVLWVTGPSAHPLAVDSKLPVDARGFIETTPSLQVRGHEDLFAVGDCANLAGTRRAGVYAVRSAPILDHNLRTRLAGGALRSYQPQRDFLSLLNLGDGTAVGTKWGTTVSGRWVLWIKDRIDRSFMEKYR